MSEAAEPNNAGPADAVAEIAQFRDTPGAPDPMNDRPGSG